MKIAFLTNDLKGHDGWSRYTLDLVEELKNRGHEIIILCSEISDKGFEEFPILGNHRDYLSHPLKSLWRAYSRSKQIGIKLEEFKPDVVHITVEPFGLFLLFLGAKSYKTVITVHGTFSVIPNLYSGRIAGSISRFLWGIVYSRITNIISVSDFTKAYLLRSFPGLEKKISVITNGIKIDESKKEPIPVKAGDKTKRILFIGGIKRRKGLLEALESLKYYKERYSRDFVYDIIGKYSKGHGYYTLLSEKIKEYGLEGNIFFRGEVSDGEKEKYLQEADLFLMLPINNGIEFEGFGLVYLEANAWGIPCIGSNDSGAREAILDGVTGYSVNPSDIAGIAGKIDLVLNKTSIDRRNCSKHGGKK